jgi:hypothetical protein
MELHLIKHDGAVIGLADAAPQGVGLIQWFHTYCPAYSMDHAVTHEGYAAESIEEIDCHDVAGIIEAICTRARITMAAEFVPFSKSRNAAPSDGEPWPSLNWKITIQRHGRDVLVTDYAQGAAHAPAYKRKWNHGPASGRYATRLKDSAVADECETGKIAKPAWGQSDGHIIGRESVPSPRLGDVMQSLIRDADVLDSGGFESWASDCGYDTDSRKAEAIYKACVEIATKLRAALGAALMAELALAAQFN